MKRTIIICDGCGRQNKIIDSLGEGESQVDLCELCDEQGRFICRDCAKVHSDQWRCPQYRQEALKVVQDLAA